MDEAMIMSVCPIPAGSFLEKLSVESHTHYHILSIYLGWGVG